ncbi:unnamed protein product [Ectocarpus sp. 12 AP-2014]
MTMQFQPKSVHQKDASFPVRHMAFDFHGVSRYFIDNEPVSSFMWLAFQAYFPEGEQFFVDAVRAVRDQANDPQLKHEIGAFIGQEAMHGKEHLAANQELERQGISISYLDGLARQARKHANRHLSKRFRLALTAAAEHFTGVIAHQIATRPDFRHSIVDERLKALVLWHAMEETEHRAVAFDLYQHTGGGYLTRALAMTLVSAGIGPVVLYGMAYCLKQDDQLLNFASWRRFLSKYWGPRGFFTEAIPKLLSYYHPHFHPNSEDPDKLMVTFRRELGIK